MQNEKPLEVEILDRFFKQIEADPDIPAVVVEDLLNLRKKAARKGHRENQESKRDAATTAIDPIGER